MADPAIVNMMIVLVIAVVTHIVVIARWSSRVDSQRDTSIANHDSLSRMVDLRIGEILRILEEIKVEILKLRERQHQLEGEQQRQKGMLQYLQKVAGQGEDS